MGSEMCIRDRLYLIRGGAVLRYTIATNTWTTLRSGVASTDYSMTVYDGTSLWAMTTDRRLVRYVIATDTLTYVTVTIAGSSYEPRLVWDPVAAQLYIAPTYSAGELIAYNPATGVFTSLPSHPRGHMNDIFCGDRSGHIYAAGASSGTEMWQYDIATRVWARITDFPGDHGNNGACTVSDSGFLWVTSGSGALFARLPLL